jgi:hypothetical protein
MRIFLSIRAEYNLCWVHIINVYCTGRFGEIQWKNRELSVIFDVLKYFFKIIMELFFRVEQK